MKVWLIKLEEPVPDDEGYRPYRMGMLGDALLIKGHEVIRWASDYNHLHKFFRFGETCTRSFSSGLKVVFLNSGVEYKKTVSVRRLLDNFLLSVKLKQMALAAEKPDVIVCAMPSPSIAKIASDIAQELNVPLILDARDMWPDIIESELRGGKKLLALPLLWNMKRQLRVAASRATSLVGITNFYSQHLLKYANRDQGKLDKSFPIGYAIPSPLTPEQTSESQSFWQSFGLLQCKDEKLVIFAGRLNNTVLNTFSVVTDCARQLAKTQPGVKFVICGSGNYQQQIETMAEGCENIIFPGEVTSERLSLLKNRCFATLLPIERRVDYQNSLPNKFFDYLSAGKPMLSWLDGLAAEVLTSKDCGMLYNSSEELHQHICKLIEQPVLAEKMGQNALSLFETEYDSKRVYNRFAEHVEKVVEHSA